MKLQITLLALMMVCMVQAQNVGINNTQPKAALDVNGDVIMRSDNLTVSDGNNTAVDVYASKFNHYKLSGPTSNFQISGIIADEHDRVVTFYNRTGFSLEVYNDDASAIDSFRILTGTGTTFAVYHGGSVTLKYDNSINRWEIISSHYNSLDNFGTGNWVANANDIYNGNVGNIGIGTSAPYSRLTLDGELAFLTDTIMAHCAASMNNNINIDNASKRKTVFHIIEDPSCNPMSPSIKTITGGQDGQIVYIIAHINNTAIAHLGNPNNIFPPLPPNAQDSLNMIELYEPTTNGQANQPQSILLNAGGVIGLIYDGNRHKWKPMQIFGDYKQDLGVWYRGGNPNHIYAGADRVGIGTGSPDEKLDVVGNIELSGEIKPNGVSGTNGQVLQSDGAGSMVWASNGQYWATIGNHIKNSNVGNVGIGITPSPDFKLDVNGNIQSSGLLSNNIDISTSTLAIYGHNGANNLPFRYLKMDGQSIQCAGASNILIVPSTQRLFLNPLGGNIGINTNTSSEVTSPLSFKNVFGKRISFWSTGNNNEYGIGIQSGEFQFYTAGQDKFTFGYGSSANFTKGMTFYPGTAQLGINTEPLAGYNLAVNGSIKSKEVVVETANWPDYVFTEEYKLPAIHEVEQYIKEHRHLPNIPSAATISDQGLKMGEMQKLMMEKIEELTLYIIEQQKTLDALKAHIQN